MFRLREDTSTMIDTKPYFFEEYIIPVIEEKYNAKYVCETCIKNQYGWRNEPSLIFYSVKKHPDGSHYFAISIDDHGNLVISDGISATEPFVGVIAENGDIIYSRFRHDYRTSEDKSVSIDGGREYTRVVHDKLQPTVQLQIEGSELLITDESVSGTRRILTA